MDTRVAALAIVSLFALSSTACATGPYGVTVMRAGNYNPDRNEATAEAAKELPWDDTYPVDVVVDTLPEGIKLDGQNLLVDAALKDRYAYLGRINSFQEDNRFTAAAKSVWWYESLHPRHSAARDVYCKVQTPLRTLTLGIYSLLVPLDWPCWVLYSADRDKNLRIHAQELKRAATAMGANLVVLQSVEDQTTLHANTYYGGTDSDTVKAASVWAFALVDRAKPTRPALVP